MKGQGRISPSIYGVWRASPRSNFKIKEEITPKKGEKAKRKERRKEEAVRRSKDGKESSRE